MNTWNTIKPSSAKPLEKAISILETLSHDLSISILNYLTKHGNATILDLTIHTGIDSSTIESQMDLLGNTGVIRPQSNLYNCTYALNFQRLKQIKAIGKQLNQRKRNR